MKVLGEMAIRGFPLSERFKLLLGPAYASDAGEATESSSSEEESSLEEEEEEEEEEGEVSQQ